MTRRLLIFLFFIAMISVNYAQLSVSNILEYQLGNLPYQAPQNLSTMYDQLNLIYYTDTFTFSGKLEQFKTNDLSKSYGEVSQRSLRFEDNGVRLTVGNFYEIIGSGLLLRSYEIPGSVLESEQLRKRYGFYKDIDGVSLNYESDFFELKALRGRPLNNDWPPDQKDEDLRSDLIEAAEIKTSLIENWSFSGAYLRRNYDTQVFEQGSLMNREVFDEFGSASIQGNLPLNLQIYSEYAQQLGGVNSLLDLSDKTAHAFYTSLNFSKGFIGGSFEYKDYQNFRLRFNDPPPLIKEHQYVLLNRSTHILNADDETGWQTEIYLSSVQGHLLTLNITEAKHNFFGTFKEKFVEVLFNIDEQSIIKGFLDSSEDPFSLEKNRYTGGLHYERIISGRWGTTLDFEYQQFERALRPVQNVENYVSAVTISYAPNLSVGIVWEHSTDPIQTDIPHTLATKETDARDWMGFNLGYHYKNKHYITLFYGERRGGPACTSGICYNVLDFEGLEFRLTSTF